MRILAIETSCDETAMAILEASGEIHEPNFRVLKNVVSSQISIHRQYGGVVPNLAKREHIKNLPIVYKKVLGDKYSEDDIDLIAVTVGPGLEPALWTGIGFAKELYKRLKKKNKDILLAGVNHMEGHLYSFLLNQKRKTKQAKIFPAVALVVSGGHTMILKLDSLTSWEKLGETRDDAIGEAFDKVARMLKLPYPGGPEVEKLAKEGNPAAIEFPRPMIHTNTYEFSFSGLKTAVLYYLRDRGNGRVDFCGDADVAASFQKAAIDVLTSKTMKAAESCGANSVILCGGVAANKALRATLKKEASNFILNFFVPPFKYNTDNAAMIGAAAYIGFLRKNKYKMIAQPGLGM